MTSRDVKGRFEVRLGGYGRAVADTVGEAQLKALELCKVAHVGDWRPSKNFPGRRELPVYNGSAGTATELGVILDRSRLTPEQRDEVRERIRARRAWTLEGALLFVRALLPFVQAAGWEVGLTGSVLYAGESRNDLDLVLYPHDASKPEGDFQAALRAAGGRLVASSTVVLASWRAAGSDDVKHVERWSFGGRKVDVFVLK